MMENTAKTITVESLVMAPTQKVWQFWTFPEHVTKWNFASDEWHSPSAQNDLRVGGKFHYRMEAKDGSFGFDFEGTYDEIKPEQLIAFTIGDGRKVKITFSDEGQGTRVIETFEAESVNPIEMQRNGWQAILNNFKKYVELN
jgi:uncharacterized protein YndB with AHSA1/START domain